ncbi:hypothetical protein D2V04_16405 [Pelagerythrobacter aerophilus]|uniref:Uncharacterized protein n=1 Tax=Pelagerythrobacter aerophilus TaxID=2306995 RepID=A0A418NEW2_9SPHN|nr:hypothetical protein D2V04_16405 [Pelagerythrobacter aerophilus]
MGQCPPLHEARTAWVTGKNEVAATHIGTTASKPPISQHPVFPAIVALWFAALLGIGSLVLPVTLFESLIVATGLHTVIPAAEPPLGVAARILIALVGAGLGALAGLYIARKVAAAQAAPRFVPAPVRRQPKSVRPAKRPISAHEELGADGFDEPVEDLRSAPIPGRRRALSLTEENGASELLDYAPLPGAGAEIVVLSADEDEPPAPEEDPLDLAAFAGHSPEQDEEPEAERPAETPILPSEENPVFASAPAEQARPFDGPAAFAMPDIDLNEPSVDAEAPIAAGEELSVAAAPAMLGDPLAANEDGAAEFAPAQPNAPVETEERPLRELSIAELVDRFAISLQRAAERAEAELPAAETPARYVPDLGVEAVEAPRLEANPAPEPAPPAEAGEAAAAPEAAGPAEAIPAALRPLSLDDELADEEHEDLALTLSLTPEARPFASPAPTPDAGDDESDVSPTEGAYSSLLSIRRPESQREFVRVEDDPDSDESDAFEPVVVFPGQEERRAAPAATPVMGQERPFDAPRGVRAAAPTGEMAPVDQAQAERALREALHKLQRLSGAA